MPILKGAKKARRRDERRYVYNLRRKRAMRAALKQVRDLLRDKKVAEADAALPAAYEAVDKAAKRGVIKDNTAARTKSRISARVRKAKEGAK